VGAVGANGFERSELSDHEHLPREKRQSAFWPEALRVHAACTCISKLDDGRFHWQLFKKMLFYLCLHSMIKEDKMALCSSDCINEFTQ